MGPFTPKLMQMIHFRLPLSEDKAREYYQNLRNEENKRLEPKDQKKVK